MSLIWQVTHPHLDLIRAIPLTQGKVALVHVLQFEELMQWKWHAMRGYSTFYAARKVDVPNEKPLTILMHRQITGFRPGDVDHWDRNGLHNWPYNLRPCGRSSNHANRGKQANNTSGFKGVFFNARAKTPRGKRWFAKLCVRPVPVWVGSYYTPEEAARAVDQAAVKYFGQFAKLNFPEEMDGVGSQASAP